MQPFTLPNNASDKTWLQSAYRLPRYSCLKMWTHTDTQTGDGSTVILQAHHVGAFGSGELKA